MREVFKPEPKPGKPDTERVFYTITAEDIGRRLIQTTVGIIDVFNVIGQVLPGDVGKRFVRVPNNAGDSMLWVCENDQQRDERLAREQS